MEDQTTKKGWLGHILKQKWYHHSPSPTEYRCPHSIIPTTTTLSPCSQCEEINAVTIASTQWWESQNNKYHPDKNSVALNQSLCVF